jgi:molybdenum cofactor guanylyltransferase
VTLAISGAVLTGGRSSRFGHDKALVLWQGQALASYALEALEGCAERFIVGHLGQYEQFGVTVYSDHRSHGPLSGLAEALAVAQQPRVALTACDMPRLTADYWHFLAKFEADIVIPQSNNSFLEPLAAIYSQRCLPFIEKALASSEYKLSGWHNPALSQVVVPWPLLEAHFGSNLFTNINTTDDLARL